MEMETEMEMEILACKINYGEINVCSQAAIMPHLVYIRSLFIQNGFFRQS